MVKSGLTKKGLWYEQGEVSESEAFTKIISFKRKILVILEEGNCDEVLEEMKPLLSHDLPEIEYSFVQRSKGINLTHKTKLVGWPSYIGLRVNPNVNNEQDTTTLSSSPDLFKEKFGAVLDNTTDRYVEPWNYKQDEDSFTEIQNAIRRLKPLEKGKFEVWIPQLPLIRERFPDHEPRCMRDYNGFIANLKTIVMLHQYQRPKFQVNGTVYIACSPVDIYITVNILKNAIADTLSGLPKDVRDYYNNISELNRVFENKDLLASYKEFSGIDISRSTFNERFRDKLVDGGLLDKDVSGKTHKYSIIQKELSSLSESIRHWDLLFSDKLKAYSRRKLLLTGTQIVEEEVDKIINTLYTPFPVDKLKKVLERTIEQEYPKKEWQFVSDTNDKSNSEKKDKSADLGGEILKV
jgi:hypothetical protein